MERGTKITSVVKCETLKKLRRGNRNKRCVMLISDIAILPDNARSYSVYKTQNFFIKFKRSVSDPLSLTAKIGAK